MAAYPLSPGGLGSDDTLATRSLSLVNATRPPQNRKRVWRACKWCKKKKAKCDGAEPCRSCINNSVDCIYPEDPGTAAPGVQMKYVQRLEDRLVSIEGMFRTFMEQHMENTETKRNGSTISEQRNSSTRPTAATQANSLPILTATPNPSDDHTADASWENTLDEAPALDIAFDGLDGGAQPTMDRFASIGSRRMPMPTANKSIDQYRKAMRHEPVAQSASINAAETSDVCCKRRRDRYADEYGILEIDSTGELRYAGSQATVNIFNTCDGLRSYIRTGLRKKGYEGTDSYWSAPFETADPAHCFHGRRHTWSMPPSSLVDALSDCFYSRLYSIFPMVQRDDFEQQYNRLRDMEAAEGDFIAVLFAMLAISAPMLSLDDPVFDQPDCAMYRQPNLGLFFYSVARNSLDFTHDALVTMGTLTSPLSTQKNSINKVMALGLLAAYLAATGNEAEAWTTIGSVVRLGQDLGLHRSPERLCLPESDWVKRRCVWLCVYVLDRCVSISLGRQLAINDADCDIILPDPPISLSPDCSDLAGFFALVRLLGISGEVISLTGSVGNTQAWRQSADSLRQRVHDLASALRKWAAGSVPPQVKHATQGQLLTERCVLLGVFFASVMLLHRPFMSNPHRESPLGNADTVIQCARAAISCIGTTADCLASIPASPFLSLYGQQVFVSCVLLMHCMRASKDELSMTEALGHVEKGMAALQALEGNWSSALKCRGVVEEFLEFTLDVLQTGKRGQCYFADEEQESEITDLPRAARTDGHDHHHHRRGAASTLHNPTLGFSLTSVKKRKISPLEHESPSVRANDRARQALPPYMASYTTPRYRPVSTSKQGALASQDHMHMRDETFWGGEAAWLSDGDLLNKGIFGSHDHLSPFLQMDTVMKAHGDVWNVL